MAKNLYNKEKRMNSLIVREIRTFNDQSTDLTEMVFLAALGKVARTEFESRGIPVPEFLDDFNRKVSRAIDEQTREAKLLRLQQAKARLENNLSRDERKKAAEAEIAAIEAELSGSTK